MSYAVLRLTDGTTTVDLRDGTTHAVAGDGWAPTVAMPDRANRYGVVTERLTIDMIGADAVAANARVATIQKFLVQASRWADDQDVAAVRLEVQTSGSEVVAAVVRGGSLTLPNNFTDYLMLGTVDQATLTIERHGEWVGTAATTTASVSATANVVATVNPASTTSIPAALEVEWSYATANRMIRNVDGGALLIGDSGSLAISSVPGASRNDAGTNSRSGNVFVATQSATLATPTTVRVSSFSAPNGFGLVNNYPRVQILVTARNETAGGTGLVQALWNTDSAFTYAGPVVALPSGSGYRVVNLGAAPMAPSTTNPTRGQFFWVDLRIWHTIASGVVSVDSVVMLGLGPVLNRVLMIGDRPALYDYTTQAPIVTVAHRVLAAPRPAVQIVASGSVQEIIAARGDPALRHPPGAIVAMHLATQRYGTPGWQATAVAGVVLATLTARSTRTYAVVP